MGNPTSQELATQELAGRVKNELMQMRSAKNASSAKVTALSALANSLVATTEGPQPSGSACDDAARADLQLAIAGLVTTLQQSPFSPIDILWGKAIEAAEKWRRTLA